MSFFQLSFLKKSGSPYHGQSKDLVLQPCFEALLPCCTHARCPHPPIIPTLFQNSAFCLYGSNKLGKVDMEILNNENHPRWSVSAPPRRAYRSLSLSRLGCSFHTTLPGSLYQNPRGKARMEFQKATTSRYYVCLPLVLPHVYRMTALR